MYMLRFWEINFKIIKKEGENMDIKLFAGKKSNTNRKEGGAITPQNKRGQTTSRR